MRITRMRDHKLEPLSPTRTAEITQAMLGVLPQLLAAKDQNELAKILSDLSDKIPELTQVAELNAALMAGVSLAAENTAAQELSPERLALLLNSSGLSQQQLADAIGLQSPHISRWLSGTRPVPKKHVPSILHICTELILGRLLISGLDALNTDPASRTRSPR